MEASLTHEEFSKQAGTRFLVLIDENTGAEMELFDVSELKVYPRQEEFTLTFRGPLDAFLDQGLRVFRHEQMGACELFIVPVRQDEHGYYYEAVFNRVRE